MVNTVIFNVFKKYDDPVGTWYNCLGCKKQSFIPDFDVDDKETNVFKFCPCCGKEIIKIVELEDINT